MLEDHELVKIITGQLQALKASLLLEVGYTGRVWDLPLRERVVTAVPCSRDPYTRASTPHLHAGGRTLAEAGLKEGNKREGSQLPQAPLQIQGEPLSLAGHSDHRDSGKGTPNKKTQENRASHIAWKG